jgi:hypothetical protein
MEFIGNNRLTAHLRQRVADYVPWRLQASLTNVQEAECLAVLNGYIGDFRYVHATTGVGYASFFVLSGEEAYVFRVREEQLPQRWEEVVPSRYERVFPQVD